MAVWIRSGLRQPRAAEDSPLFYPDDWGTPEAWIGEGPIEQKAYAVFEGIAFALRKLGEKGFGAPGGTIVALGGGSALDDWVQLVANVFQRPLERTNADGLDGAAEIAGVPVQSRLSQSETFEPMPEKISLLEARYLRWKSSQRY